MVPETVIDPVAILIHELVLEPPLEMIPGIDFLSRRIRGCRGQGSGAENAEDKDRSDDKTVFESHGLTSFMSSSLMYAGGMPNYISLIINKIIII